MSITPITDRERRHKEYSYMKQRDAEIAIAIQLKNENPQMTDEQAISAGEKFIREGSHVEVLVEIDDGRKARWFGPDRSGLPRFCCECW